MSGVSWSLIILTAGCGTKPAVRMKMVGNGQKSPQPFSTFTFEYKNESENSKAGHENERKLMEYREFQK
jgi:hypothetical protein